MAPRLSLPVATTALSALVATLAFPGLAAANGDSATDGIDIVSIAPDPAMAAQPISVVVTQTHADGKTHPFKLKGSCVADYMFDGAPYTGFKPERTVTVSIKISADAQPGPCKIKAWDIDSGAIDAYVIEIIAPAKAGGDDFDGEVTPPTTAAPSGSGVTTPAPAGATTVPSATTVQQVQAQATTTTPAAIAPGSTLPRTGSSSLTEAWFGAALAAIGAAFLVFARRRTQLAEIESDDAS